MRNFGIIDEQMNESLEHYFAQCSLLVTCEDVAISAATLANIGRTRLRELGHLISGTSNTC